MEEIAAETKSIEAKTATTARNEVRLIGRVSADPESKTLPSGDVLWQLRIVVPRLDPVGKQTVDVVDCVAWSGRARRSISRWVAGDEVELTGALRRRFYRAVGRTESRTEVEVFSGRIRQRAPRVDAG